MRRACLSWCLCLLLVWYPAGSIVTELELEDSDRDWGSGLHELLNSFPADSPFVRETPGRPANCTQRFWLPPSSPVCWDDIAGPRGALRSPAFSCCRTGRHCRPYPHLVVSRKGVRPMINRPGRTCRESGLTISLCPRRLIQCRRCSWIWMRRGRRGKSIIPSQGNLIILSVFMEDRFG